MAPGAREATHSRKRVRRSKGASTNFAGADHLRPASRPGCPTLSRILRKGGVLPPSHPVRPCDHKTPRRHAPSNPVILTNLVILSAAEESQYFACATTEPQVHPNHLVAPGAPSSRNAKGWGAPAQSSVRPCDHKSPSPPRSFKPCHSERSGRIPVFRLCHHRTTSPPKPPRGAGCPILSQRERVGCSRPPWLSITVFTPSF